MLKKIREATQDDRGFTLIELMVVVLIIAILIAIAIPTFLGLRRRAQDRSAQSDIRNALTQAKAFYTDYETYVDNDGAGPATTFNAAAGLAGEPSLLWVNGGVPGLNSGVHVYTTADTQEVLVGTESDSGQEFYLGDNAGVTVRCRVVAGNDPDNCTNGW